MGNGEEVRRTTDEASDSDRARKRHKATGDGGQGPSAEESMAVKLARRRLRSALHNSDTTVEGNGGAARDSLRYKRCGSDARRSAGGSSSDTWHAELQGESRRATRFSPQGQEAGGSGDEEMPHNLSHDNEPPHDAVVYD